MSELVFELKPDELAKAADNFPQTTTIQRLGYLLEKVLEDFPLADALYRSLNDRNYYPSRLNPKKESDNQKAPNRWKIIPNMNVEIDDL
jgi:hypothetical protein